MEWLVTLLAAIFGSGGGIASAFMPFMPPGFVMFIATVVAVSPFALFCARMFGFSKSERRAFYSSLLLGFAFCLTGVIAIRDDDAFLATSDEALAFSARVLPFLWLSTFLWAVAGGGFLYLRTRWNAQLCLRWKLPRADVEALAPAFGIFGFLPESLVRREIRDTFRAQNPTISSINQDRGRWDAHVDRVIAEWHREVAVAAASEQRGTAPAGSPRRPRSPKRKR